MVRTNSLAVSLFISKILIISWRRSCLTRCSCLEHVRQWSSSSDEAAQASKKRCLSFLFSLTVQSLWVELVPIPSPLSPHRSLPLNLSRRRWGVGREAACQWTWLVGSDGGALTARAWINASESGLVNRHIWGGSLGWEVQRESVRRRGAASKLPHTSVS
jgi:hypothetical protein